MPAIILASASPRREQFLRDMGLAFTVRIADIDETPRASDLPADLARRLAIEKAQAVANTLNKSEEEYLIVAADTVVAIDDQILGKPLDTADALRMLTILRDRPHQVHSALCIQALTSGEQISRVNTTDVKMRPYSDAEMQRYAAGGDPLDKAGAYAIQHPQFAPVERLDGCFAAVMGLPLADLHELLVMFGVTPPCSIAMACKKHNPNSCCQE
jgi:MAF protein